MAQRVATEYKNVVLELKPTELQSFITLFNNPDFNPEVRIYENGEKELVLHDNGEEIPLTFKWLGTFYYFEGEYTIRNLKLANQMRVAVRKYKGTAIAHRIFPDYTMIYTYRGGNVIRIIEEKKGVLTLVFEYKDTAGELQRLYESRGAEDEIAWIRLYIDQLLDLRNRNDVLKMTTTEIDRRLLELTQQLFVLEA